MQVSGIWVKNERGLRRIQLNMSFTWCISKKCWKNIFDTYTTWSFIPCNQIMTDAVSLLRYDVEQEVDRPVIWNVMMLMWRHCDNNVSETQLRYYKWFCSQLKCVDISFAFSHDMPSSKLIKRTVIWDAMALMRSHYNENVAKRDFGITNDFFRN